MKYIIIILIALIGIPSVFAQGDMPVMADGKTKYYIKVYDGDTNEKVLYNNASHASWQTKIQVADFFDGSSSQLWSFQATEMFPGYFSVINHDETLSDEAFLMSWSWHAYMGANRDPAISPEMQYRFVEVADGWYKFETIEKEDGLNNQPYTPGADALNITDGGFAQFRDVKSADVTSDNMVNKVFKIVEFNPMALFEDAIIRGDDVYNATPDISESVRYDLFYQLEKAREVRVFGSESQILAHQDILDSVLNNFNMAVSLNDAIEAAEEFIAESVVDNDVKTAFTDLINDASGFLNADVIDYPAINGYITNIDEATKLVNAIETAEEYKLTLAEADPRFVSAVDFAIENAKNILDAEILDVDAASGSIFVLENIKELVIAVTEANELIATTQEAIEATGDAEIIQVFEDAKAIYIAEIDAVIAAVSVSGINSSIIDNGLNSLKAAKSTFQKSLEAGDTFIVLNNPGFEAGLENWNVESPTPGAAYPENKGVDGSKSITCWKGADYQMKVYQSITDIPNGNYIVTCMANVNIDSTIALFAESDGIVKMSPVTNIGGLVKRTVEIEVTNGAMEFGIRGAGENNSIPKGNWIVFDEFEVKLSSVVPVANADFEAGLENWDVEGVVAAAYPENKGVDASKSITCWRGQPYNISISQSLALDNGVYTLSAVAKTNVDSAFVVFGESEGVVQSAYVVGDQLAKFKTSLTVTDGMLKFGIKGAGEDNAVPKGNWIVFDNIELTRTPDVAVSNWNFEQGMTNWLAEGVTAAAYAQNKGVDGSQSITCWRGQDYNISVSQTTNGIINGTYAVSVMANTNADSAFVVFGESNDIVKTAPVVGAQLSKTEAIVEVHDGSLKFGVKGAGEDNAVPKGNWVVFDNVELKIQSIIPTYVEVTPSPSELSATGVNDNYLENSIIYRQINQSLSISSVNEIVKYKVYSLTGAQVAAESVNNKHISITVPRGIYVVSLLTNTGYVETKKIIVR